MKPQHEAGVQRLLLTIPEAAKMLGLSRAMLYKLIKAGKLRCIHIGRAARVSVADIRRLIQTYERDETSR